MSNIATIEEARLRSGAHLSSWLWLALGCLMAAFACGGGLDIATAAWLMPIFLLRFGRNSSVPVAVAGLLMAMLVQTFAYLVLNAIPFNVMTLSLGLVVSSAYALPLILDRLIGVRLSPGRRILLLPVAMVAVEFGIGSVLPLGTAIGMRATTQGENLALLQIISITGPYAIAFLIGVTATVANRLIEEPSRAVFLRYGAPLVIGLATIVLLGQARLAWSPPATSIPSVRIAAINPDLEARRAVNELLDNSPSPAASISAERPEMRAAHSKIVLALLADTRRAARAGAKIVVWSETAAPTSEADKPALLAQIASVAREEHIYLNAAIGVPYKRNETFLFGPDGRQLWHYRKNHPIPGMEPVPPFENAIPVVTTPYGRLANLICFDGDFPALARVRADIMMTPSWDWPEVAYAHTMRMVRLRAIENGYALIRPVFNGVTGAFDRFGRTLAMQESTSHGARMTIVDVPIRNPQTIYNHVGDLFAWICCIALFALVGAAFRPQRVPSSIVERR